MGNDHKSMLEHLRERRTEEGGYALAAFVTKGKLRKDDQHGVPKREAG